MTNSVNDNYDNYDNDNDNDNYDELGQTHTLALVKTFTTGGGSCNHDGNGGDEDQIMMMTY